MDSLPARLARREALRARARVLSTCYARAEAGYRGAWLAARAAPRDLGLQDALHAALLRRAAREDMLCEVLDRVARTGDPAWADLVRQAAAQVRWRCGPPLRVVDEESEIGVDQAPGWAFEGGPQA
jgi:hypothetical protein